MSIALPLGLDLLLFAERFISHTATDNAQKDSISNYRIRGQELFGWERLLAEARASFLSDLIEANQLAVPGEGMILEVDDGKSILRQAAPKYGVKTSTFTTTECFDGAILSTNQEYTVGVTHTLLEHCHNIDQASELLEIMSQSSGSMVHQVHEADTPGFGWDDTHRIRKGRAEWVVFFDEWAASHEGWTYLGNHQGINGRPANYVLEKDGNLPFYTQYDKKFMRRLVNEVTAANAISISRVPLVLTSFALAKNNPPLLSALLGFVYSLDAADGYVARRGLGNSPYGAQVDIVTDHIVELATMFEFAYDMNVIPKQIPWALASRDLITDFLRLYNAVALSPDNSHPHEAFGTSDRQGRVLSGAVKTVEAVTIPLFPSLGVHLSTAHLLTSVYRGLPVLTSDTSKRIYEDLLRRFHMKK